MTGARALAKMLATGTLIAVGLAGFAILLTIGMTKSGPSAAEAIREYWPVGAALLFVVLTFATVGSRPRFALVPAVAGAVLIGGFFKIMAGA